MANKKISQLTAAAALTGTEIVPIVQSGITVSTTAQDIADLAPAPSLGYLVYQGLVTQTGTSAPTVTEIVDTIGITVSFTRGGVGYYEAVITGGSAIFPSTKTILSVTPNTITTGGPYSAGYVFSKLTYGGPNVTISISCKAQSSSGAFTGIELSAGLLLGETPVVLLEIRVYP